MYNLTRTLYKNALFLMSIYLTSSCAQNLHDNGHQISSLIPKNSISNPNILSSKKQYSKIRKPEVESSDSLTTGSLNGMQPVHFFMADRVPKIGDIITIKIKTPEQQKSATSTGVKTSLNSSEAGVKQDENKVATDEKLKAMLDELPEFSQESLAPIKDEFKARILGFDNAGDFVVSFNRETTSNYEMKSLNITARIPRNTLVFSEEITTDDLFDISWQQTEGSKELNRESLAWEPTYTRELERFTEARSTKDIELEEKRLRLEGIKKRLGQEIKSLAEQKNKFVGEREKLQEMQKLASDDSDAYLKRIQEEKAREEQGDSLGNGDENQSTSGENKDGSSKKDANQKLAKKGS